MKTHTFKHGIHPTERKELSNNMTIETAFPSSKTVIIPVTQGGAPNQPIVKVGDKVARGQKIATSDAFMSSPVHASVSGVVKKIENRLVTGNTDALCIIIACDEEKNTDFMSILDPFKISKEEALKRVKDAGLSGMGGASFPTHVKLNPPSDKKIDFVLANAAECEPYLTIDERCLQEKTKEFIDGLKIAMHITGANAGAICLEDNKSYLIPTIEDAITKAQYSKDISVVLCKTKYPQGGEKSLILAATGREVPAKGLPADAGCVVQNVGTLIALSEAFRQGKPLIERGLTISGEAVSKPKNLYVPIGTSIGDLIPEVIELKGNVSKIISGGPMMGMSMMNASFPVAKNTSGVLFMEAKDLCLKEESPCINCGKCIDACPYGLYPVLMTKALKADSLQKAVHFGLMDCVECGCCSFVCPSNIKLVQRFRTGKNEFRTQLESNRAKAAKKEGK